MKHQLLLILLAMSSSMLSFAAPTNSTDEGDDDIDLGEVADKAGDVLVGFLEVIGGLVEATGKFLGDEEVQKAIGGAIEVGTVVGEKIVEAGAKVIEVAPEIAEKTGKTVGGFSRTLKDTKGFIEEGLNEFNEGLKLATIFGKTYSEHTANRIDTFLKIFNKRLQCNTKCEDLDNEEEKAECEKEYCDNFEPPKTKEEEKEERFSFQDEYDYSESDGDYEETE